MSTAQADYVALLLRAGETETYADGDVIFADGSIGDRMYIVKSGAVSIVKDGRELETVEEGQIFGELALIDREPRSASAIASGDCELVSIEPRRFWFLVQETPYFAQMVMRVMADRLRRRTG
jgi:CRP-like cAMP-binding protein